MEQRVIDFKNLYQEWMVKADGKSVVAIGWRGDLVKDFASHQDGQWPSSKTHFAPAGDCYPPFAERDGSGARVPCRARLGLDRGTAQRSARMLGGIHPGWAPYRSQTDSGSTPCTPHIHCGSTLDGPQIDPGWTHARPRVDPATPDGPK